jgi:S1-C subfamily serine protease
MTTAALGDWSAARRALVRGALSGVVEIERRRGGGFAGIVWDSETVVTAAEALRGAESLRVRTAEGAVEASIVAMDLSVDVAVLRASIDAPGVAAATATALEAGDEVVIAGRSEGLPLVVWSHARLVGPAWRSRSGGDLARLIRLAPGLDARLEGAGVFDLEGRLCAMAVPGPRRQTLGVPCETIGQIVSMVRRHGRVLQPYLGIRLQSVHLDQALQTKLGRSGAEATIVVGVEPNSPAEAAGLIFGDLLLSAGGRVIESALDLKVALGAIALGSPLPMDVYRAGERREATAIVRDRSDVPTP